jgi:hypothetical protein
MVVLNAVLSLIALYAVVGIIFAVAFVMVGVKHVDDATESSTLGFRILILPGSAALWPVLLLCWLSARKGGDS